MGPLLFLIFVNDLSRAGHTGDLSLFADDANYYEGMEDLNQLINSVNSNIKFLIKWFLANKLSVNIIKTEAMLFSRKNIYFPLKPINVDAIPIPYNYKFKFLEVLLDFKLNWKSHLQSVQSKLSSACGILYKVRNSINQKVARMIYYGIAHPYLNYCNLVWSSCYPSNLQPLQTIQKKLIRLILKRNRWAPSDPLFKQLRILKLSDMNKLITATFVYKSINNYISSPINYQFRFVNQYNLRNQNTMHVPFHRSRQTELFVHIRGARLWNEIPQSIRNKTSVFSFKRNLKIYYLDAYE